MLPLENLYGSTCQVHFGRLHKIVDVVGHVVVDQVVVQLKWKEKHLENSSKNLVLKPKMIIIIKNTVLSLKVPSILSVYFKIRGVSAVKLTL